MSPERPEGDLLGQGQSPNWNCSGGKHISFRAWLHLPRLPPPCCSPSRWYYTATGVRGRMPDATEADVPFSACPQVSPIDPVFSGRALSNFTSCPVLGSRTVEVQSHVLSVSDRASLVIFHRCQWKLHFVLRRLITCSKELWNQRMRWDMHHHHSRQKWSLHFFY